MSIGSGNVVEELMVEIVVAGVMNDLSNQA